MNIQDILLYIALPLGGVGGVLAVLFYRHQKLLQERAEAMVAAVRHRDFSFRLPGRDVFFGERALQDALLEMGQEVRKMEARREVESWQKLTRVLTHEIMNATAPIQSICQAYLNNPSIKGSPYEEGIQAIHDTTLGLTSFVDSYRKLTQLQEPVLRDVNLHAFCHGIASLYPQLEWCIEVPAELVLRADEVLLRQVFINLTKNAIEADAKRMGVKWDRHLYISNNGRTIPDEVAREIFVPFFTTKSFGSGIGLSLSRQILMMQGMVLSLREHPLFGYNVTFEIED